MLQEERRHRPRVYVELHHCALFHFALSPFAEWKPSTSHPSNPVPMHLLLTSYITITLHASPLPPGYLHRDLALFHSSESTYYIYRITSSPRRERPSIDRAFNRRRRSTCDSSFPLDEINGFNLRSIITMCTWKITGGCNLKKKKILTRTIQLHK